ncbi:MAG: hypothetical protein C5B50_15340 [Verrucomicrobia bacterium]|nr:MAG: hypothetical protein C5B50_15340 [Verrucomicrobiota bacterium]
MQASALIWVAFTLCLALSFLCSGMEAGVFALSRLRIRRLARSGRRSAQVLYGFLENPENFLWTILVGNTVANCFILGWAVVLLYGVLKGSRLGFIIVFSLIVFLLYAFLDLLPKMFFRAYPNRLCLVLARPFRGIHLVLWPLVALAEWVSDQLLRWSGGKAFTGHLFGNREELRLLMQESGQAFTSEERTMISRVLDLQTLTVRQIMLPLEQTANVSAQAPLGQALALCRERKVSRLPVLENRDGQKRVVGVISLTPILFQEDLDPAKPVADFVRPALYLEEDLRLEVALRRMQRSGQRLAIVLGRDRSEIGFVTLQDALKVIFGEVSL